jgi:predicted secreted protein
MRLVEAAAIYVFIWCLVLTAVTAVLPSNVGDAQETADPSTRRRRLAIPRLGGRLLWTTVGAGVLFALYYLLRIYSPTTFNDFAAFVLARLITPAAIYFILWWVVLFAVLPWGVRSQVESGEVVPGTDPGAPAIPALKAKLLWTTVVTTVVFAMGYIVHAYRLVTLEQLAAVLGMPR